MSCNTSSPPSKDYMKMEDSTLVSDTSTCLEKKKATGVLKQGNDMSQTICLFRKYLLAKTQPIIGRKNMEESQVMMKKMSAPANTTSLPLFTVPKLDSNSSRHPSFLEQQFFPGIRSDAAEANSDDAKSSKSQLTIFYAGTLNVYDNVPIDKAQAIMLFAGESSSLKPSAIDMPKADEKTPLHRPIPKLEQNLPIARKISLQHFLEKRRQRMVTKSPYSLPPNNTKNNGNESKRTKNIDGSIENQSFFLSPFPSRLGYFFHLSTNKSVDR